MNEVRTYSSENQERNVKSKRVLCPNCHTTGFTIVKKECDTGFCAIFVILILFPILIFCIFFGDINNIGKKEVHYCRYCNHDCTNVESLDENCCIII